MSNITESDVVPWILSKFARHGWWGAKHTSFDNIPKGAPLHLRGIIKGAAEQLIKDGLLVKKPTSYGLETSLNFERKDEIFGIIERWRAQR
ncbi:hypothetical protein KAW38_01075 [Candidatus Micrarchaeota archaeon]|nr:hypothetical protein [Candidatus Micrarchaeota archaeon]